MHKSYHSNGYANELGSTLDDAPKAVIAAVAVSFIQRTFGDDIPAARIEAEFNLEWQTLWENEIVKQKPKKLVSRFEPRLVLATATGEDHACCTCQLALSVGQAMYYFEGDYETQYCSEPCATKSEQEVAS